MDALWWGLAIVGFVVLWLGGTYVGNRFQESWKRRAGHGFPRQQGWAVAIVVGACIAFILIGGFIFIRQ